MKILIFGSSGMLGKALVKTLSNKGDHHIYASQHRTNTSLLRSNVNYLTCDVLENGAIENIFQKVCPEVVINCVSPPRMTLRLGEVLQVVPLCTLLPHRINKLCLEFKSQFIHISTDAVFSGRRGFYVETDDPDPIDTYGRAKLIGEVSSINAISLRTSMIGHESEIGDGLLDWFLRQKTSCKCYSKAVFSGLPVSILAKVIADLIIGNKNLYGIYNIASSPISKYTLMSIVADVYKLPIEIYPDENFVIDRSLSPLKFYNATGFIAPSWIEMVNSMYADHLES
jgi:dTDP-4-dehydrorhamnose reductase